jgi:hypothetical protein
VAAEEARVGHVNAGHESERRRRRREQRRRRREERQDGLEAVGDTCEAIESLRSCGSGCARLGRSRSGGSGGDGCSCDGPCDLFLLRVSPLLVLAAAVVPARGTTGLVRVALRGYQRWLSRFTPVCPSTPSCSAYALDAVARHGARRGLRLAAARVRACG